jgi:GT2 family glycosyltransferase
MQASIIIVNWNAQYHLCNCLRSVFRQSGDDLSFEVIVVDNASTDDSVRVVRSRFPEVGIIENTENRGFAAANNQGIRASAGNFVLLLNPDAVLLEDSLSTLWEVISEHPRVGILGPRLLNQDGSVQPSVMSFPSFPSVLRNFVRARTHGMSKVAPSTGKDIIYVPCVAGACILIRREIFEQVGLLDESYYMYAEEIDFCFRASEMGWKVAYTPLTSVTHLGGQSTSQRSSEMYVERRTSRIRFLLLHRGFLQAFLVAMLVEAAMILKFLPLVFRRDSSAFRRILSHYHQAVYPMLFQGQLARMGQR